MDSLYVWREGATHEDFEELAKDIEERTHLPLAIRVLCTDTSSFFHQSNITMFQYRIDFFAVGEELVKSRMPGLECRRHDTPPLLKPNAARGHFDLAGAHDFESYLQKLEIARIVLAGYEERLASGDVEIKDLVVSKRISKEPRDYQKAGVTAIAAQQLFGSGVKLRPGQNLEYIITDSEASVPNDRVRAFALWEGWHGYDRQ